MGCAGRYNPFFCCPRYERDGVARVASEVVLPVGHHQNLAVVLSEAKPTEINQNENVSRQGIINRAPR